MKARIRGENVQWVVDQITRTFDMLVLHFHTLKKLPLKEEDIDNLLEISKKKIKDKYYEPNN